MSALTVFAAAAVGSAAGLALGMGIEHLLLTIRNPKPFLDPPEQEPVPPSDDEPEDEPVVTPVATLHISPRQLRPRQISDDWMALADATKEDS